MEKAIIVAVADNLAIGKDNDLLWHLSDDLKYFKKTTLGSPVIMGYMTFKSLGSRPLPKRKNIVISILPWSDAPQNITVVSSLEEAYKAAEAPEAQAATSNAICKAAEAPAATSSTICVTAGAEEAPEAPAARKCFVIGGGYTYRQAMADVDKLYITHVHTTIEDADTYFPEIDPEIWEIESKSETHTDEGTGLTFEFVIYKRKKTV